MRPAPGAPSACTDMTVKSTTADRIADYLRYCDETGMTPTVQVQH